MSDKRNYFFATFLVVLILISLFSYLAYNFYYPKMKIKNISNDSLYGYELFKGKGFVLKIPKDWVYDPSNELSSKNSWVFRLNASFENDFLYIWTFGYAFDAKELAYSSFEGIDDYKKMAEGDIEVNGIVMHHLLVSYDLDSKTYIQDIYSYVKDGKGYLFVLRVSKDSYNYYSDKFKKAVNTIKIR